jgi:hypothetical protein
MGCVVGKGRKRRRKEEEKQNVGMSRDAEIH